MLELWLMDKIPIPPLVDRISLIRRIQSKIKRFQLNEQISDPIAKIDGKATDFFNLPTYNTIYRNFKQTLIELERLYDLLIEVEDCEKKLTALPTGTSMRLQVKRL